MLNLPPLSLNFEDFFDHWSIPDQYIKEYNISLRQLIFTLQDQFRLGNHEFVWNILTSIDTNSFQEDALNSGYGFILFWRGIVCRKTGKLIQARIDLLQASKWFIFTQDYENYSRCLLCLGDVLRAKAFTHISVMSALYLLKAFYYYYVGKHIFETKVSLAGKQDRTYLLLSAQFQWAVARIFLAFRIANKKVEKKLLRAWDLSCQANSVWAREECAQLIARYHEIKNNLERALEWYKISYTNASSSKNVDRLIETLISLAKISKRLGDVQSINLYKMEALQVLSPLLKQKLPSEHQFYYFASELESIK